MHLVVGLGNPGARYAKTRHNVGFLVVDALGARWSAPVDRNQFGAEIGIARTPAAVLAKPQSFMNLSGQPVASLKGYYKVALDEVVVVHDDVDLPFGDVRIKQGGGHGGHNGLRDLIGKLGDPGFVRVRFGIGRPPTGWDTADYVLARLSADEEAAFEQPTLAAADAVEGVIRLGLQAAMKQQNTRPKATSSSSGPAEA
jgi:PTH1 family peptidyl-tRNA hydrolase